MQGLYCTGILLIVFFFNGVDGLDGWNEKRKNPDEAIGGFNYHTTYQASYHTTKKNPMRFIATVLFQ